MARKVNYRLEADKAAKEVGIPTNIFRALVGAESGWNPNAVSPVGARGLTQLMPATAKGLGVDMNDPISVLRGGARYLRQQLDTFGSMRLALAAYNAGPGNVREYGGVPPFKETQRYVRNIMQAAPTETEAVQAKPNKQQPTLPSPPPAANLLAPSPLGKTSLGMTTEQTAFDNLTRIGRGESPTRTLGSLVESVSAPAPAAPTPAASQPQPVAPVQASEVPAKAAPLKAGGGWGGSFNVASSLAQIAKGHGLQAVSEKRDRQTTATGGVSDHWTGSEQAYAFDLSNGVETPDMDKAAVEIAKRLGVKYNGKSPLVLTVRKNGYRIQVLYRTDVGGNHHDHIHVGVKKEG